MTFVSASVAVRMLATDDGPTLWQLEQDVVFKDKDTEFRVPVGYITDFASVPRCVSWAYPRSGSYNPAAIIHDWLITDMLPTGYIESTRVDEVFRLAMKELGVPWFRQWVMWNGVRWGALINKKRRGGWWKTSHKVLASTLLVLPVLPAAIAVQATLLVGWLVSLPLPKRAKVNAQKT